MPRKKKVASKDKVEGGFYKGYDIKWLRENPDHPDFPLVAKAEKILAKQKKK